MSEGGTFFVGAPGSVFQSFQNQPIGNAASALQPIQLVGTDKSQLWITATGGAILVPQGTGTPTALTPVSSCVGSACSSAIQSAYSAAPFILPTPPTGQSYCDPPAVTTGGSTQAQWLLCGLPPGTTSVIPPVNGTPCNPAPTCCSSYHGIPTEHSCDPCTGRPYDRTMCAEAAWKSFPSLSTALPYPAPSTLTNVVFTPEMLQWMTKQDLGIDITLAQATKMYMISTFICYLNGQGALHQNSTWDLWGTPGPLVYDMNQISVTITNQMMKLAHPTSDGVWVLLDPIPQLRTAQDFNNILYNGLGGQGHNASMQYVLALRNAVLTPPAIPVVYSMWKGPYNEYDSVTYGFSYDFRFSTDTSGNQWGPNNTTSWFDAQLMMEQFFASSQSVFPTVGAPIALPGNNGMAFVQGSFQYYALMAGLAVPMYAWCLPFPTETLNDPWVQTNQSQLQLNPLLGIADPARSPISLTPGSYYMSADDILAIPLCVPNQQQQALRYLQWWTVGENNSLGPGNAFYPNFGVVSVNQALASWQPSLAGQAKDAYATCVSNCLTANPSLQGLCVSACAGVGGTGYQGQIDNVSTGNYYFNTAQNACVSAAQYPVSDASTTTMYASPAMCQLINPSSGPQPPKPACPGATSCYVYLNGACTQVPISECGTASKFYCTFQDCCQDYGGAPPGCTSATPSGMASAISILVGVAALVLFFYWLLRRRRHGIH